MSRPNKDRWPVAALGVIFLGAGLLLWVNIFGDNSSPGRQQIGTITYKTNIAERKMAAQVLWNNLSQDSPVYNGDTIHTTAGSMATIHLVNQIDLNLGEETLVRLEINPDKPEIFVSTGSVATHKAGTGSPLGIKTSAGRIILENGNLAILQRDDAVSLVLQSGKASWVGNKSGQEIKANQNFRLSAKGLQPSATRLVEPAMAEQIYRTGDGDSQRFRWALPKTDDNPAWPAQLIVAKDAAFQKVELQQTVQGNELTVHLPTATHYWKVVSQNPGNSAEIRESPVGWFNLNSQEAPILLSPRNQSVKAGTSKIGIAFSWLAVPNAKSYLVAINDRRSRQLLGTKLVETSTVSWDKLAPGDYSWKVSALCGPSLQPSESLAADFSVRDLSLAMVRMRPVLAMMASKDGNGAIRQISASALRRGMPIASWEPDPGADCYETRIYADPAGKTLLKESRALANSASWEEPLPPAVYYLRVRSISGDRRSGFSEPLAFKVIDAMEITAISPADNLLADPDQRQLEFRWSDPNQSPSLRLQLADEPEFSQPWLSLPTSGASQTVQIPAERHQRIYWRVVAPEIGKASLAKSFYMPFLLDMPQVIAPADGLELDINQIDKLLLSWKVNAQANQYQISMFGFDGGRELKVENWQTAKQLLTITKLKQFGIGNFRWSIRALRLENNIPVAQSAPAYGYFSIKQSHSLPPPVVHRQVSGGVQ